MFKIRIYTDSWHEIQNSTLKVLNPVLKEKLNGCGSLTFSVPVGDTYYSAYERFKTKVEVSEDGAIQFVGRLLETSKDFYNTLTLTFEGEMAYLNDVQYPPYEFSGTISELFTAVLTYYNSNCTESNQIQKGNITVTDKNNYIARADSSYSSCWAVLSKKLVELCGGYLRVRWVVTNNQVYRYLDYLEEAGTLSTQEIEYGENIIGLTQELKGDDIITCIIPFGATNETTGEKVDITSVNPTGKNYILSDNVSIYGRIEKIVEWEDVTLASNLYNKALAYLQAHDSSGTTIKVNAVDLHAVNVEIARLDVGDKVKVKSTPHGINTTMLINERERNLNDVSKDTITLGNEEKTFTSSVDRNVMNPETSIDEEVVKSLARQQTDILLGGNGGYFEMLYGDSSNPTKPTGFRIMDSESSGTAQNVILVNNNGIGFSNDGVNGTFFNAWTIDGRLSASAIATGVLQDSQGNFILDLDTGTISVSKLTLNTPDLIFGDVDGKYIEVTNYENTDIKSLKGNGTVYTDTDVKPWWGFEIKFELNEYSTAKQGVFGSYQVENWGDTNAVAGYVKGTSFYLVFGATEIEFKKIKLHKAYKLKVIDDYNAEKTTVIFDDDTKEYNYDALLYQADGPTYLHAINEVYKTNYFTKFTGNIYYYKTYNNNLEQHYLFEARKDSDVYKFYDVTNSFYITPTGGSYLAGNFDKVGVLFNGNGQIKMMPEGRIDLSNYLSGSNVNNFTMSGHESYKYYYSNVMANYATLNNMCYSSSEKTANYIQMLSMESGQNAMFLYNKAFDSSYTGNSISLQSSGGNSMNLYNYRSESTAYANYLSMSFSNYNTVQINNAKVDPSKMHMYNATGNQIYMTSAPDYNRINLWNGFYEALNGPGNEIYMISASSYNYVFIANGQPKDANTTQDANIIKLYRDSSYHEITIKNNSVGSSDFANKITLSTSSGIKLENAYSSFSMDMNGNVALAGNNGMLVKSNHYNVEINANNTYTSSSGNIYLNYARNMYINGYKVYLSGGYLRYS